MRFPAKQRARIAYGARALTAGGIQSLPKLVFPGGVLIGDDAGFLNAARIKGSHCAIKSGMLAAETCFDALGAGQHNDELAAYPSAFRKSWLYEELHKARNFKPWMSKGLKLGSIMFGIDQLILGGKAPWTLHNKKPDHSKLKPASECLKIEYAKPDGLLIFDRLSSVFLSSTHHEEDQPCHLQLIDPSVPIKVNLALYDAPEQRFRRSRHHLSRMEPGRQPDRPPALCVGRGQGRSGGHPGRQLRRVSRPVVCLRQAWGHPADAQLAPGPGRAGRARRR